MLILCGVHLSVFSSSMVIGYSDFRTQNHLLGLSWGLFPRETYPERLSRKASRWHLPPADA